MTNYTITAFGIDFNLIAMLNRFLEGVLFGCGVVLVFLVFALYVSKASKTKKKTKLRVKLISLQKDKHD